MEHSELRAAAITEAARVAGAFDPMDAAALIPPDETLPPAEAVAALKLTRPHIFKPKRAAEMSSKEYAQAKAAAIKADRLR